MREKCDWIVNYSFICLLTLLSRKIGENLYIRLSFKMWRKKRAGVPPSFTRGVFDATVGRCIFTQLPLSVTAGARAHSRSPLRLNEHRGHVSETAAAGTVAPQWIHGQLCSCAPLQSGIRENPKNATGDDGSPVTRRLAVHPRSHSCGLFLHREIHVWHRVLGRHREAPRLGCVGVAMADRDSLPLPLEVRARFAELELELSEGE